MKLSDLKPCAGARKKRKRVGRGPGSGHGKTSTRGQKGDRSRSGYRVKFGYEGGQMPLTRRIPKRGFVNIFKEDYETININDLAAFEPDTVVTPELLKERKLIKGKAKLKILGQGEIKIPLTVKAHKFSKSAQEKIIKASGKIEEIK
ncbi:MAG TPA: 50S ribosomal protein L15 [candidate division WOR-3 bacterium]|uniref:Large ribosomal subunit protein uL15 n=1 Tax=candidate division WOR-3 bacterium TaxID=2052148 RepID=A0A9C9K189_UNCW3|nr:50S ribosomal protein L15 [candidate division WOR-3 bacterium]